MILKDNRAFCKYVCPITVFLKPTSKFSLIKIRTDKKCKMCGACEKACPMYIKLTEYIKKNTRVLSSEYILCNDCINACPEGALDASLAFDFSPKEEINFIKKTEVYKARKILDCEIFKYIRNYFYTLNPLFYIFSAQSSLHS